MSTSKSGSTPSPIAPLAEAVTEVSSLDGVAERVGENVRALIPAGPVKDALSGTWLGHALHPLLTDIVIGSFTSASALDLIGGDEDGRAAERLIALGIAAYLPTAATGASDWADSEPGNPPVRRVGIVHASSNAVALGLYAASLAARRRGDRRRGKLLGLSGAAVLAAGGYLGSHLSFVQGIGVDQTAFDAGPDEWTEAGPASDVQEGRPRRVFVADTPVMLIRQQGALRAMHDRCSHRGCSLSEGEIDGEAVVCACHGSRFRLADGSLERGPATTPQPAFAVRERDGTVEIRLR